MVVFGIFEQGENESGSTCLYIQEDDLMEGEIRLTVCVVLKDKSQRTCD